jgi:hypothetical protein
MIETQLVRLVFAARDVNRLSYGKEARVWAFLVEEKKGGEMGGVSSSGCLRGHWATAVPALKQTEHVSREMSLRCF